MDADEPLLPVDPKPPSRVGLRILLGGAGAALLAAGLLLFLSRRPAPPAEDPAATPAPPEARSRARAAEAPRGIPAGPRSGLDEEKLAKELFDAAEAVERAQPADFEKRMARWREVVTKFPTSGWARQADERLRAATASLQAYLDREFDSTRKDAQTLAAAGHFVDAIEAIQAYRNAQARDVLKRRAELEIGAIENASRLAFNESVPRARELTAGGNHAAAAELFESLGRGSIPEVAARCRAAAEQIRTAAAAYARHQESRKGEEARRALREDLAPKILALVRARQFDDALRELTAAAGGAAHPAVKEEIVLERAAVADASSFWEAFLKTLRSRVGQDATLLLSDGKRVTGRISRVLPDRIVLDSGDGTADAPLDKLHADVLVGWTLGRSLPAQEAVSYLKAALFFFCDGRDDLAKLYLATARELNGSADASEKVFREGYLRAAMSSRK